MDWSVERRSRFKQERHPQKGCGHRWGTVAAREPGLGTGRGGDVTGSAFSYVQCDGVDDEVAVATVGRGSPSETQLFGLLCDWRLTKR
jgi:hypothetical protein